MSRLLASLIGLTLIASVYAQTEDDWQLRRYLKSLAETDYFAGYDRVRRANLISVFWEYVVFQDPPTIRGKTAPRQPILRVWIWNNTDEPLRVEPSAFRFVDGGYEVARNNSARTHLFAMSSTIVRPRSVYVGDMVMNVRTGKRYTDSYALLYTSPRPKETIVLHRYLYWKNAISEDEYQRSFEKQKSFSKLVRSEETRLDVNGIKELAVLATGSRQQANDVLKKVADRIREGRGRPMAGLWEMQIIMAGPLLIPSYLQSISTADKKQENVKPMTQTDDLVRKAKESLKRLPTQSDAGPSEQASEGYFVGTKHRRGDYPAVVFSAEEGSGLHADFLAKYRRVEAVRFDASDWRLVTTWRDVEAALRELHATGVVTVRGVDDQGQQFQSQVEIDSKVIGNEFAPKHGATEAEAGTTEEAKEGFFVGTTHRRGDFPSVLLTATPESYLGPLYRIEGIRLRSQETFTAVSKWSDVERFLKNSPAEEVIVQGTNDKGQTFSSLVKVNKSGVGS